MCIYSSSAANKLNKAKQNNTNTQTLNNDDINFNIESTQDIHRH